jgi:hypothetical protein
MEIKIHILIIGKKILPIFKKREDSIINKENIQRKDASHKRG